MNLKHLMGSHSVFLRVLVLLHCRAVMTGSSWVPPLTCNLAIYLILIKMAPLPLYFIWEIKFLLFCIKSWSVSPKLTSAIGYLSRCRLTANLTSLGGWENEEKTRVAKITDRIRRVNSLGCVFMTFLCNSDT